MLAQDTILTVTLTIGVPKPIGYQKIAIIGNSIVQSPPKFQENIHWLNAWGMAATEAHLDWAHQLWALLAAKYGAVPELMVRNFDLPRALDPALIAPLDRDVRNFVPDLMIVQVAESLPANDENYAFALGRFFDLSIDSGAAVMLLTMWYPDSGQNAIIRKVTAERGGVVVNISDLYEDPQYHGNADREYPDAPVGTHPGDAGMQEIARRVIAALP